MAGKTFPWVLTPSVPWADGPQFTRGVHDGLPLLSYGCAPRTRLATRRQLREMGLRPNGQDPVAVLYVRHRRSGKANFASLYLIDKAAPVRPMTRARWTALAKANLARRICPQCGRDRFYVIPPTLGACFDCVVANETTENERQAA
ncbi:RRQRL motif-containing zinc-binding protein [Saccharothrix sp.]|uniref:RRQRL motif-containing zinc-binding protein n=1 Tax=Saccharothrix sp. TaxID=1873460 RepID=UPI002810B23B|nr:RRQRL motif-containing zinc-binding protein [Saccharothrix sp.]